LGSALYQSATEESALILYDSNPDMDGSWTGVLYAGDPFKVGLSESIYTIVWGLVEYSAVTWTDLGACPGSCTLFVRKGGYHTMSEFWTLFIALIAAVPGIVSAFLYVYNARVEKRRKEAENKKLEEEKRKIQSESSNVFAGIAERMATLNEPLMKRITELEEKLTIERQKREELEAQIEFEREEREKLAEELEEVRLDLEQANEYIKRLIKQLTENGIVPVDKPQRKTKRRRNNDTTDNQKS